MNQDTAAIEALLYIDGRFNPLAPGDQFMVSDELLLDVFGSLLRAAEWYDKKGGTLKRSHDGMHALQRATPPL